MSAMTLAKSIIVTNSLSGPILITSPIAFSLVAANIRPSIISSSYPLILGIEILLLIAMPSSRSTPATSLIYEPL